MTYIAKKIILCILIGMIPTTAPAQGQGQETSADSDADWQKLADGLELGAFRSPQPAQAGDSMIRVLRVDPARFQFKLLNASASKNGRSLSAKKWCRQSSLVAAINASMYQEDYKTSVSLMRTKTHVNNPRLSKDMTILAFDRQRPDVPLVKIIDRQCENFKVWRSKYGTLVQSIRMISCTGKNVWRQQSKKWSTAAFGIDHQGRVLFIHVASPYSTHDLINILKMLPLNIDRAMYAEGGPQAQLYINIGDHEYEFVGGHEIDGNHNGKAIFSWPIPNVVGIALKGDN